MSLLGREPVFEVVVTTDKAGMTKCTSSTLEPDAPAERIVEGLLRCAATLSDEADKVARQAGLVIDVNHETGVLTIKAK